MKARKTISGIWLALSLLLPCCLDLERLGCCVFALLNLVIAFLAARRHCPELWVDGGRKDEE